MHRAPMTISPIHTRIRLPQPMESTALAKRVLEREDAIYPINTRKPVAAETMPVSLRVGQYILQRTVAAEFAHITAITIINTFKIGCFIRNTPKKNNAERVKVAKRVRSILLLKSLYTATVKNTVRDIKRVAMVNIAAAVLGGKPRCSEK